MMTGVSARLAIAGVVIGVVGALFLRKFMASYLYELSVNDPVILSVVPAVIVLLVLLACCVPARRPLRRSCVGSGDPAVGCGLSEDRTMSSFFQK